MLSNAASSATRHHQITRARITESCLFQFGTFPYVESRGLLKQPERATSSQTPMYHHPEIINLNNKKRYPFSFFTWLLPSQKSVRALKWENSNGLPSWADKYNHGDSVDWFLTCWACRTFPMKTLSLFTPSSPANWFPRETRTWCFRNQDVGRNCHGLRWNL